MKKKIFLFSPALGARVGLCFEAVLHALGAEVVAAGQAQRLTADILHNIPPT